MDERRPTDLEAYRRRLEADLEIAELVHRSMIPSNMRRGELEIACNFAPVIGVGGDYASVHFQDDQHVKVGICDVSGHGVAAALLASRVNSFVLNIAPSARHPCDVVVALNEFIHLNFGETGLYLTFFSLFVDLETRVLSYSGCGHPPVLLYSKKENNVVRLESENPIIGLFEDLSPTCAMLQIPFERGDRMVLYTDGITDAGNPDGLILGVDGLEGYLKETAHRQPEQMVDAIVRRVEDFRGSLPADDDQLLLSISSMGDA